MSLKPSHPSLWRLWDDVFNRRLHIPPGSITTVYQVEIQNIYYSKSYQCVEKQNSYTIAYLSNFVYVHVKVFAIIKPLKVLPVTCEENFGIAAPVSFIPVQREDSCFVDSTLAKCLFIECESQSYIEVFPPKITFD